MYQLQCRWIRTKIWPLHWESVASVWYVCTRSSERLIVMIFRGCLDLLHCEPVIPGHQNNKRRWSRKVREWYSLPRTQRYHDMRFAFWWLPGLQPHLDDDTSASGSKIFQNGEKQENNIKKEERQPAWRRCLLPLSETEGDEWKRPVVMRLFPTFVCLVLQFLLIGGSSCCDYKSRFSLYQLGNRNPRYCHGIIAFAGVAETSWGFSSFTS